MKTVCITLLLAVALLQVVLAFPVPVTQDFVDCVDAAAQELVADSTYTTFYEQTMFFPVPTCSAKKVSYPTKNPFAGRSNITLCLELGTLPPWLTVKQRVGEGIVQKINAHYGTNIPYVYKQFDTTVMGYFDTLKSKVDSGECDIISSNATPLPARVARAHFQCNWGSTSYAFLRSARNSSTMILNDITALNKSDVIIGFYDGTSYSTYARTYLSAATFVPYLSASAGYQYVLDQTVHAIIGDAIQYFLWFATNNATCGTNCTVKAFGNSDYFGTFITNNITTSFAPSLSGSSWMIYLVALVVMFIGAAF